MPNLRTSLTRSAALAALLVATVHAAPAGAAPTQRIAVSAGDSALTVTGADTAHAGFARLLVRNASRGSHGIALVRLKHRLTTPQVLRAFADENPALLESLGGIQDVAPGRPWEMTVRLVPGSYALVDFGQNGPKPNYARGLYKRFRVAASSDEGTAPAIAGEIAMRDFRFDFRLPERFSGHGIVRIANLGRAPHEITLVRIDGRHSARDVLDLIVAGAPEPPRWASIVELVSVLDAGKAAYVKLDLAPGRYVALCLIDEPGSHKLHAQLGMIRTFDVT
jgi:hypothetical protein